MPRLSDLLSTTSDTQAIEKLRKKKRTAPQATQQPLTITTPDFVAIDVETTGLDDKSDHVIEVGAVLFTNGIAGAEYSTLINPGRPLPRAITDLTGITETDLAPAPSFEAIADTLRAFIGDRPVCGHQIDFDAGFLNAEYKRAGLPEFNSRLLDTALLSRIILLDSSGFSLKQICRALGVTLTAAHRALHDARASGECAVALLPRIDEIPVAVRKQMIDIAPPSIVKAALIQSLNDTVPASTFGEALEERTYARLNCPEVLNPVAEEAMIKAFSADGDLAHAMPLFIARPVQRDMALSVTAALNSAKRCVIEAGTGIGKSLAYLLPAATMAVTNDCRIFVSTHTRTLQDQLISQDLPLVAKAIKGSTLRFCALKGRANYLCRNRFARLLRGDFGPLSAKERTGLMPLIRWAAQTQTGDIEEQNNFNRKWHTRIWNSIAAESHACRGRQCPDFRRCFLQMARQRALSAHVVVINHALFFSDICSEASFLGKVPTIIFDEAHHLESCGHRHLRVELDTRGTQTFFDQLGELERRFTGYESHPDLGPILTEFNKRLKQLRKAGRDFLDECAIWARTQDPRTVDFQVPYKANTLDQLRNTATFLLGLEDIRDTLRQLTQNLTAMQRTSRDEELCGEATMLMSRASQIKADTTYLAAANTEDHVFWCEGNSIKGWIKLCGVPLDVGAMLSTIWDQFAGGIVFTSATLSIAGSMEFFQRKVGLFGSQSVNVECHTFPGISKPEQMLRGTISLAPNADDPEYAAFVATTITAIATGCPRNMLVLFTSHALLSAVYRQLKQSTITSTFSLLAQDITGNRYQLLEELKRSRKTILLGADSFWEGVDAPGEACEIVIIPRLPFAVPTHPLTRALAGKHEAEHGESFFSFSLPEAVIRFRQGVGRLIRTAHDRGAIIVLDHRIATKGYGKQFSRSLGAPLQSYNSAADLTDALNYFFNNAPICDNAQSKTGESVYVPFED